MFATTYPRIRVSTSIYTWIISRGGVLFPTTYPRIRVSTSIYTWIISRGGVVFATTYTRIRVSTSIYTWIIFRRGVVFATTYPCIRSLQGSSFEMAGYSAVTPAEERILCEYFPFTVMSSIKLFCCSHVLSQTDSR